MTSFWQYELKIGEEDSTTVPLDIVIRLQLLHGLHPAHIRLLVIYCEHVSHQEHVDSLVLEEGYKNDTYAVQGPIQASNVPQPVKRAVYVARVDQCAARYFKGDSCLELVAIWHNAHR